MNSRLWEVLPFMSTLGQHMVLNSLMVVHRGCLRDIVIVKRWSCASRACNCVHLVKLAKVAKQTTTDPV